MMRMLVFIVMASFAFAANGQTPTLTKKATGLNYPTHLVSYKQGFLVTELRGGLRYIPDLTIDSSVVVGIIPNVSNEAANGLYGIAVHPEFQDNNFIYVHYTYDTTYYESRLSRFELCNDTLVSNSEKILLSHDNLASIHQGGNPIFGTDGYLYISKGDGEENNAPKVNAQNPLNIHGSVLRLDVSGDDFPNDANKNYKIPIDNPFIDSSFVLDEIYAFGVRSPWRLTLDKETSDIYLGDVGWSSYEEINIIKPGNYGWGCMEGPLVHEEFPCIENDNLLPISPVYSGKHDLFGSITAGYVYRGSKYPEWVGKYFFADFKNGKLCIKDDEETACWDSSNSSTVLGNFVSFGEDHTNELYIANHRNGIIYSIDTTVIDCSTIPDSIHVSTIDQAGYSAEEHIFIEAEFIRGINFRAREHDILSLASFVNSNLYLSSDVCYDFQNGVPH